MKNIWLIILALIAVGAGAWYFNKNYISESLPGNSVTQDTDAVIETKDLLVFKTSNNQTKTVSMNGRIENLTTTVDNWPDPLISPDGKSKITVQFSNAERDYGYTLFVSGLKGEDKKQINQNEEPIGLPRWSNDGQSIYYTQAKKDQTFIMKIELASKRAEEILSETGVVADLITAKDNTNFIYLLRTGTANATVGDIILTNDQTKNKKILAKGIKILGWLP